MKKKVLIIVENIPVPFDRRVWKESLSLQADEYEVTALCPRGRGYTKGHEVIDGVHIYRHPMPNDGDGLLGYLYEYSCALFWECVYAWWFSIGRGFHVIEVLMPTDVIFPEHLLVKL